MSIEITEIAKFLKGTTAFQMLTDDERAQTSREITIRYVRAGETILQAGKHNQYLFMVRSGAVELRLAGEELTARLGPGSAFAYPSLLRGGEVHNTTSALEDTLLYAIPASRFHALREVNQAFKQFFAEDETQRLRYALKQRRDTSGFQLDAKEVGALVGGATPVTCETTVTIAEAVQLMHSHDVSTLAICDGSALRGIFTDKDLRNRVVAKGQSLDQPIASVMTEGPKTLSVHASAAEAMAMMAGGGFRHIPLVDQAGALTAILSATDILSAIGNNAIDTGMMIAKSRSRAELVEAASHIVESFAAMVASGLHAAQAMRFTSALGEATHRRAIELAEEELGPAPCPYAFVVFGSLAREEQLVGSDQDNGFIISDEASEADFAYFEALGALASDTLNECGFVYCKGGIMVKNAEQRRTLSQWRQRYEDWIARPNEDRILRATIFFDMRHVYGDADLTRTLHDYTLAQFKDSPLFVSYLARDALRTQVPLGFFRNLVLETTQDGEKVFDAKRQAIIPIVDIARTHALAAGVGEVGTIERLHALAKAGKMHHGDAQSLEDALILVNEMRIQHQARQVQAGRAPDNLIAASDLSSLERDYLKDAFAVVRQALDALRRNFAGGIA
ncbi:CBS domain-containing protein [Erythrobacter sp. SCSIO 43205]|uniref:putative nucleotidyltransferase substrate binding domain-containing protein n=1 Tax=Erythrobacter sp. SCSIO 43205 TaxID=2779361 RepID=UPI001CA974DE|nr:putative nucleotidyltransferase substrate binding domain-containing protein [Erythrobacter sp. SCSIO 43205]UAB78908.1 CBS domain-containing protein [Erythrobacter sp. SCSIO 43205]